MKALQVNVPLAINVKVIWLTVKMMQLKLLFRHVKVPSLPNIFTRIVLIGGAGKPFFTDTV